MVNEPETAPPTATEKRFSKAPPPVQEPWKRLEPPVVSPLVATVMSGMSVTFAGSAQKALRSTQTLGSPEQAKSNDGDEVHQRMKNTVPENEKADIQPCLLKTT